MTTSSRVPIKSGFACFFFSVSFPFFAKNPIMHQRDKSDSITLTKQVELISSLSQSLLVFCHNPNVLLHLP